MSHFAQHLHNTVAVALNCEHILKLHYNVSDFKSAVSIVNHYQQ